MRIDLTAVPFSRAGSSMAISLRPKSDSLKEGLYLRAVHKTPKWGEVFRISLRHKKEIPFRTETSPTQLRLIAAEGHAEFIFSEPSVIHFRTSGVGLRLQMKTERFDNAQPLDITTWMVTSFSTSSKFLLNVRIGKLAMEAPWEQLNCRSVTADFVAGAAGGQMEGTIREIADHIPVKEKSDSFSIGMGDVQRDWSDWRAKTRAKHQRHLPAMDLAAYVNWSSIVAPRGNFKHPTMLMSKNIMSNVWSWDHCFNAMAHCESHPKLAWDQFMFFFDHQAESGAIPDCMGDHSVEWDFTKPPVHGWALSWMLSRGLKLNQTQVESVYSGLCRLTEWWFRDRDFNGNGLPEYYHGNDSGWDNGSVFKTGGPVESPDIVAFLLLQTEALASLASRLNRKAESAAWKARAKGLLVTLTQSFWRKDQFVAYGPGQVPITDSHSLFLYLPLVLGNRLPAEIRVALVKRLRASGLITQHGLATEAPRSPLYQDDGYWRGPIWAPSTLLIVDGLREMGQHALSQSIARKFCRLCVKSGFAENFDALSGDGLRDRSYTWTASVFLIVERYYADSPSA